MQVLAVNAVVSAELWAQVPHGRVQGLHHLPVQLDSSQDPFHGETSREHSNDMIRDMIRT